MGQKISYLLLIIFLTACGMKPLGVISEKTMENIFYDLTITDAVVDTYGNRITDEEKQRLFDDVFEKNGVSREKFDRSLDWYAHHPKRLEFVYEQVKKRVEDFVSDVETYKLRPHEKAVAELNRLDTIEIYRFEPQYTFDSTPNADTLRFEVSDPAYFALGDRFVFELTMYVEKFGSDGDTLKNSYVELTVVYADNSRNVLKHRIVADKKRYRYTFTPGQRTDVAPIKIEGSLFSSDELVSSLKIDGVRLCRIYDPESNPLPEAVKLALNIDDGEPAPLTDLGVPQKLFDTERKRPIEHLDIGGNDLKMIKRNKDVSEKESADATNQKDNTK